jgi:hypothetical protein
METTSIILSRPKRQKRYRRPSRSSLVKLTGDRERISFQYRAMRDSILALFNGGVLEQIVARKAIAGLDELYRLEMKGIDQREEYQDRVRRIRGYVVASERETVPSPFNDIDALIGEAENPKELTE